MEVFSESIGLAFQGEKENARGNGIPKIRFPSTEYWSIYAERGPQTHHNQSGIPPPTTM